MDEINIMVVDDNPNILYSVKEGLESFDESFHVERAMGGTECLEKIKKMKPDLILMDIMMPELDGWEVVAILRSQPETKDIPIIYLTAKTDDLSRGLGSLTSKDYVEKPFDTEDLRNRILNALK